MKKLLSVSIILFVISGIVGITTYASSGLQQIQAYLNDGIKLTMNGQIWQAKDREGNILYPITYQGNTYMPTRAIAESYGLNINWSADKNSVSINDKRALGGIEQWQLEQQDERDINGDQKTETIQLFSKINLDSANHIAYHQAFLVAIKDGSSGITTTIPINQGGYVPKLEYADVTGDGIDDILVTAPTGGSGGEVQNHLYSYQGKQTTEIPLPAAPKVTTVLLNNYQLAISDSATSKTSTIDITDKKPAYENNGNYTDGIVTKPIDFMIFPVKQYQFLAQDDGTVFLKGFQTISGLYHADVIADVMWIWKWENNGWILRNVQAEKPGQVESVPQNVLR